MKSFYAVFGVGMVIFASILMLLTIGMCIGGTIGFSRWIVLMMLELLLIALGVQLYENTTE